MKQRMKLEKKVLKIISKVFSVIMISIENNVRFVIIIH